MQTLVSLKLSAGKLLCSRGGLLSPADASQNFLEGGFKQLGSVFETIIVGRSKCCKLNLGIETTISRYGRLDGAATIAGFSSKHSGIRNINRSERC